MQIYIGGQALRIMASHLNPNNDRLECQIREWKKQFGLGLQSDIYIDTSFDHCNSLKKSERIKSEKINKI